MPQSDLAEIGSALLIDVASELLRAHRKGHHLIVMSRQVSDYLIGLGSFSGVELATLRRIAREFTSTGNAFRQASVYIDVVSDAFPKIERRGAAIHIPIGLLSSSKYIDRPKLLVENIGRDGWAYEFILRNIRDLIGCGQLNFDLQHGGGDDIAAVFKHMIQSKYIVAAVVDSDRSSPLASHHKKLSKLNTVKVTEEESVAFALSPPCREVENIYPFDVITAIDSARKNSTNEVILGIVKKEQGADSLDPSVWLYFDLKEGVSTESISKMAKVDLDWLVRKFAMSGLNLMEAKVPGYGLSVTDQIKSRNEHCANLRASIRTRQWMDTFLDFFRQLAWVFCSTASSIV